jgi:DNA mismatch repair ATPase MutL
MYIVAPLLGSSVYTAIAENVVSPAQNPGNKKWRWFVVPRRSIKTSKNVARATPKRFATRVAVRELVINSPMNIRRSEPSTPPSETNKIDRTLTASLMY